MHSQRDTTQRRAIRVAIDRAARPLAPTEILEAAKRDAPKLGIATVYRTIKNLVDEGKIIAVEIPGESARYELAGKPHHHHFYCRECEQVYPISGCARDLNNMLPSGFTLEDHHVVLYGRCNTCGNN